MKARQSALLLLPALVACSVAQPYSPSDLVDISDPAMIGEAIYMISPASRQLVEVLPGPQGEEAYTDLEEVEVNTFEMPDGTGALHTSPDDQWLLSLAHGFEDKLMLKRPGVACDKEGAPGCPITLEARPLHDQLVFSPNGQYAISYISEQAASGAEEVVVNLNEIAIYDLESLEVTLATIGFAPHAFAFTNAGDRMVALTNAKVAVVELATGSTSTRELTLGTDSRVAPAEVVVTHDDHYALVTVKDSADLYTFDLTLDSLPINIVGLSGNPVSMDLAQSGEETLILTSRGSRLDVLHHDDLTINSSVLPESVAKMLIPEGGDYALLFSPNTSSHNLHYFDIEEERLRTYLLDNPCSAVIPSPGAGSLVIYYNPETGSGSGDYLDSSYAVAILNLDQGDRQPNPVLTSLPPGAATFEPGTSTEGGSVFVALTDYYQSQIARVDLNNYASTAVETAPMAYHIEALPADGRVVVVHNSATGMLSIFEPSDPQNIQFIHGFLTQDLF